MPNYNNSHRFFLADSYQSSKASRLVVYTDGSCINNGKANPSAGIGVYIPESSFTYSAKLGPEHRQTNQRAELDAVRVALVLTATDRRDLELHLDSKYVIEGLTSWSKTWIQNGWKQALDNGDLFKSIIGLAEEQDRNVFLRYVPGHSGVEGNEVADKLAQLGATRSG